MKLENCRESFCRLARDKGHEIPNSQYGEEIFEFDRWHNEYKDNYCQTLHDRCVALRDVMILLEDVKTWNTGGRHYMSAAYSRT